MTNTLEDNVENDSGDDRKIDVPLDSLLFEAHPSARCEYNGTLLEYCPSTRTYRNSRGEPILDGYGKPYQSGF
jgi:hypothetical protein